MKHRLVLFTALGLLVLAAALPGLASAGQVYKTTTSMRVTATKAEGKLSSEKAACVKNREVDLRVFVIGGTPGSPVSLKTDAGGHWSIELEYPSSVRGQVEVRVPEKSLRGGRVVCGTTEKRGSL